MPNPFSPPPQSEEGKEFLGGTGTRDWDSGLELWGSVRGMRHMWLAFLVFLVSWFLTCLGSTYPSWPLQNSTAHEKGFTSPSLSSGDSAQLLTYSPTLSPTHPQTTQLTDYWWECYLLYSSSIQYSSIQYLTWYCKWTPPI